MICLHCDCEEFMEVTDAEIEQEYRGLNLTVKTPCMACKKCGWRSIGVGQLGLLITNTKAAWRAAQPTEVVDWPTDAGYWMGNLPACGWFPLCTKWLFDDLWQPWEIGPPNVLAVVAQMPRSEAEWPFLFKGNHPATGWRRPDEGELKRISIFYGETKQ